MKRRRKRFKIIRLKKENITKKSKHIKKNMLKILMQEHIGKKLPVHMILFHQYWIHSTIIMNIFSEIWIQKTYTINTKIYKKD